MESYLDVYLEDLLHINDGTKNKLIDLNAGDLSKTVTLFHSRYPSVASYALEVVQKRFGKTGNTVLLGSALRGEQIVGRSVNDFEWKLADGLRDPKKLDQFISGAYQELNLKGNNPLFLCVGAVRWKIAVSQVETRDVSTPLLIFPIRLIRSTNTTPVYIEFVHDDAYFNPCLYAKLKQVLGEEVADAFPHPNGAGEFDSPLDLEKLGAGEEYFTAVAEYMKSCIRSDLSEETVFAFERDTVAIVQYKHEELCTYYDVKRNREKIDGHELVRRVFCEGVPVGEKKEDVEPTLVLPADSFQRDMIRRAVSGESIIIKGPPGTGKTQTIANMISAFLANGKRVLLASKKLSALSEVNAKLPEELRKFVMLLDCETETEASKVNPSEIRQEFRALLQARKGFHFDGSLSKELDSASRELAEAYTFLSDYVERVFLKKWVTGGSYFEALNTYFKNDCTVVPFADGETLRALSGEDYEELLTRCKEAGERFFVMTDGGAHSADLCPWKGVSGKIDLDGARAKYSAIATLCEQALKEGEVLFTEFGEGVKNIPLADMLTLARNGMDGDTAEKLLAVEAKERTPVVTAYEEYCNYRGLQLPTLSDAQIAEIEGCLEELSPLVDGEISLKEHERLSTHGAEFLQNAEFLKEETLLHFSTLMDKMQEMYVEGEKRKYGARAVLKEEAFGELEALEKTALALSAYSENAQKAKTFDFKGKKAYRFVVENSYLTEVSFAQAVACAKQVTEYFTFARERKGHEQLLSVLFRRQLTDSEIACFQTVVARKGAFTPVQYLQEATRNHPVLLRLKEVLQKEVETGNELIMLARYAVARARLQRAVETLFQKWEIRCSTEPIDETARTFTAISSLKENVTFASFDRAEQVRFVTQLPLLMGENTDTVARIFGELTEFDEKYFTTEYAKTQNLTYARLAIFAKEAEDGKVLSSALEYEERMRTDTILSLRPFFAPFERGEVVLTHTFAEAFEHSFYFLALDAYRKRMKQARYGLGENVKRNLYKIEQAEDRLFKANIKLIESSCMAKIDVNDKEYLVLNSERDPSETLRSLFRKHASLILKLKRCMILSPSTASVLFRTEDYEQFDVVIVDEASQLEPVNLIPVLFRCKQCVIVGDEWQMPPIKHFVTKYEKQIRTADGEETFVLEPEISALTLALRHHSFRSEELICHYRSKTESLIAFSQSSFYPNMRTFPAPRPMDFGLGFVDEFVSDGTCNEGVNVAEAKRVVEVLQRHFERYYDEETGVLSQSFGIVAFGEKQIEYIERLVEREKTLNEKLKRARSNFKDVPEKLAFFKTIETVQGQETEHLILSITYGRTKEGAITSAFGQLNRDKLGKCIFNVAVTRARSSVTVVHSVKPEDITGENVRYIREYLEIASRYIHEGREQFVSEEPERGFVRSVGEFIRSCGVNEKRIVYNYGVTDGSVRMPIAILSEDMKEAVLGIRCEIAVGKKYDYLDYNLRYLRSLERSGWNVHTVYAHDWADNAEAEQEALQKAIQKYVK